MEAPPEVRLTSLGGNYRHFQAGDLHPSPDQDGQGGEVIDIYIINSFNKLFCQEKIHIKENLKLPILSG
jgi:hypothetical protein